MRVTALELFAVPPRRLFLKLSTDDGVVGWGEPIVEGRDPFQIEDVFQALWRGGLGGAERLAAARSTGLDVAVDFHGRVHRAMAKRLVRALEPHGPLFVEEPVLPEHGETLREVARGTSVPIACGERLYTRRGFKDVLTSGAVDIVQPDLSHAGGLLETRKIAAMVREAARDARMWHSPVWRNDDGTVAEW